MLDHEHTHFIESTTPLAWRVGYIIGEVVGLLHPNLDTQDPSLSCLEALARLCQRRP